MDFKYATLDFKLRFWSSPPRLSPSLIRGSWAFSLKRIYCVRRGGRCEDCRLASVCPYAYLFETQNAFKKRKVLRLYRNIPHPLVLEPPRLQGPEAVVRVVLIGRAIAYYSHLIYGVVALGEEGMGRAKLRFVLGEAVSEGKLVYKDGNVLSAPRVMQGVEGLGGQLAEGPVHHSHENPSPGPAGVGAQL